MEMSGSTHSATKYHVSEDLNPKQYHYDNLKSCIGLSQPFGTTVRFWVRSAKSWDLNYRIYFIDRTRITEVSGGRRNPKGCTGMAIID